MRRSLKPPAKPRPRRDAEIPPVPTVTTAAVPPAEPDDPAERAAEEAVRRMVEAAYT